MIVKRPTTPASFDFNAGTSFDFEHAFTSDFSTTRAGDRSGSRQRRPTGGSGRLFVSLNLKKNQLAELRHFSATSHDCSGF